MPALPELQRQFAAAILAGEMAPLGPEIAPIRLGAARRAGIYRNHFAISLGEALALTFPVLQRLVGEAYFAQAARRFAAGQPPTSPVLFEYGEAFPAWLAEKGGLPYLAAVGAFEWAINHAYHADDAAPLTAEALAAVPAERHAELVLRPHPSAQLLVSDYPVLAIWRANQPDADAAIDLAQGGDAVLVWRHGIDVVWRKLDGAEAAFVEALLQSRPLADACGEATARDPACAIGRLFAELLAGEVFAGILLNPVRPER